MFRLPEAMGEAQRGGKSEMMTANLLGEDVVEERERYISGGSRKGGSDQPAHVKGAPDGSPLLWQGESKGELSIDVLEVKSVRC